VRGRVLGKYLGQLGLAVAILQCVPIAASLLFGEFRFTAIYAAIGSLTALVCLPLARLEAPVRIQVNEALAISALIFILGALANVPAFLLTDLSLADALFEAVSGITTTGLTVLSDVNDMPATVLLARAWSQWYGGLGIVVLSMPLLAGHSVAWRHLRAPEASIDDLATSTRTYARRALVVYSVLTVGGIAALLLLGVQPLHAFSHVFAAVSTGGFSSLNDSLAAFAAPAAGVLLLLSVSGSIALPVCFLAATHGWRTFFRDQEVIALLLLMVCLSVVVTFLLARHTGLNPAQAARHGVLLAISAQTTTGFTSTPLHGLPNGLLLLLAFGMLIGGSLGSTAGGIKLMRAMIISRLLLMLVRRTAVSSHAVTAVRWGDKEIAAHELERMLLLVVLFVGVIALSWLAFELCSYEPMTALFEVVSATATVGLSTGITATLPDGLKLLLCFDMLAGRLEIVALLVLLYPRTWFGRRSESP
jgi:trk system potassium uptake protein TrkH